MTDASLGTLNVWCERLNVSWCLYIVYHLQVLANWCDVSYGTALTSGWQMTIFISFVSFIHTAFSGWVVSKASFLDREQKLTSKRTLCYLFILFRSFFSGNIHSRRYRLWFKCYTDSLGVVWRYSWCISSLSTSLGGTFIKDICILLFRSILLPEAVHIDWST